MRTEEQKSGSAEEQMGNRKVFVVGLGRSGRYVARFLLTRKATALAGAGTGTTGTTVYGIDDNPAVWKHSTVKKLLELGLIPLPGSEAESFSTEINRLQPDFAIVSPGISDGHPIVMVLKKKGVPVLDELDYASQFLPGKLIAVTGTNGKSTTCALIANILKRDGKRVFLGGNIAPGKPLSAALLLAPREYYVVEVSSFQLERARFLHPHIAVVLNVSGDHLNRHKTVEGYAACKARIMKKQNKEDWTVLNYDDPIVRNMGDKSRARKIFFSMKEKMAGGYFASNWLWFDGERIIKADEIKLPGRHNIENALAAICATMLVGVAPDAIRDVLRRFSGLEHRLELTRAVRGVVYINNSMCTNPRAGVRSIETFGKKVVLIAGGRGKGVDADEYLDAIARWAKWVILLGENREELARGLLARGFNRFEVVATMKAAVDAAARQARAGDIVLFSPGFASFDMFRDFQERGRAFKNEVRKIR